MGKSLSILFVLFLVTNSIRAGGTSITDPGAKNLGSSWAHVVICEKEGLMPSGTSAYLTSSLRDGLTQEAWVRVKSQYQTSLHEKKIYSVAKDKWFDFRITRADCRDIEKVVPIIASAFGNKSQ